MPTLVTSDAVERADRDADDEADQERGPEREAGVLRQSITDDRPEREDGADREVEFACREQQRHAERDDAELGQEGHHVGDVQRRQELAVAERERGDDHAEDDQRGEFGRRAASRQRGLALGGRRLGQGGDLGVHRA